MVGCKTNHGYHAKEQISTLTTCSLQINATFSCGVIHASILRKLKVMPGLPTYLVQELDVGTVYGVLGNILIGTLISGRPCRLAVLRHITYIQCRHLISTLNALEARA